MTKCRVHSFAATTGNTLRRKDLPCQAPEIQSRLKNNREENSSLGAVIFTLFGSMLPAIFVIIEFPSEVEASSIGWHASTLGKSPSCC